MRQTFTRKCSFLKWALWLALFLPAISRAQTSITPGGNVLQDFNSMSINSPTGSVPAGWFVSKTNGVRNVTAFPTSTATERIGGNNISSSASNGIYNFGDGTTNTDRAVGGLASGSASQTVNIYTQLRNTGTAQIPNFTISYDVEQYRNGTNAAGFWIKLYYSTNGTSWTAAGPDFETIVGPNGDNNGYTPAPGNVFSVTAKQLPVSLNQNSVLYLAWSYSVASGTTTSSAPALGLDNVKIEAGGTISTTPNPVPAITGISPNTAAAGSANVAFTVTGSNFTGSSVINFNGVAKATTFVSATQLTATLTSADLATAGNVPVTVTTPTPGGGTSNTETFTITPAAQPITYLSIVPGDSVQENFTIGTSTTASLPLGWYVGKDNAAVRTVTSFSAAVSETEQRAGNNMSSSATSGIYNYASGDPTTVTDRAVGGLSSGSAAKNVNIFAHLKNTSTSNIPEFTISYDVEKYRNGTNAAGFRIQLYYSTDGTSWNSAGTAFETAFPTDANNNGSTPAPAQTVSVKDEKLQVALSGGNELYLAWNYSVASGTTTSNAQALGIDNIKIKASGVQVPNPVPVITTLSPNNAAAGSAGFTLTINGSGFVSNSAVSFNGATKTTTFISASQLTVSISSVELATAGSVPVVVTNPTPGGGTSNTVNFTITPATQPTISTTGTLTAFSTTVGMPTAAQTYQVSGAGLTNDITVTAPAGFQISLTSGSGYGNSLTLSQTNGSVSPATIYARYNPTVSGTVTGNIVHASAGAASRNVAVSGSALSAEPTTQASLSFGTVTASSIVVNLSGGNGQKNLLLVREGSAVNATPVDGTTYNSAAFGSGTQLGTGNYVVYAGSGNSVTVTGLQGGTTYYFAVFAFNDDNNAGGENYLTTAPGTGNQATGLGAPNTYTWNVASGNWTTATSWSPARTTPAVNDILVFNGATQPTPAVNLDFSSAVTIGQLKFINSANPTFTVAANRTINIDNAVAGTDFLVEVNSHLIVSNSATSALTIQLASGETGVVNGGITFRGANTATHRLLAADNNSLVFESGSTFVTGTNFSGNAFGTTSLNSVWFKDGATYIHRNGSNPFGAGAPNAVVTFASNSHYLFDSQSGLPSLSGRVYGNLEFDNPAFVQNMTGGSALTVNNLTITNVTTANFNLTNGITILGDLRIETGDVGFTPTGSASANASVEIKGDIILNGGTLTFNPAQANNDFLSFTGTGTQTIRGTGAITIGNNATTTIAAGTTISLQRNLAIGANLNVNGAFNMAPTATITFNGSAVRTIGGSGTVAFSNMTVDGAGVGLNNALQVGRLLTLNSNLATNGRSFTLLSDATGTALVVNNGGAVIGTATMQRYIEPGLNSGLGYRHYASPVVSTTVADLATSGFVPTVNAAYNTAVKPAAIRPFPTVFAYNQSRLNDDSARFSEFTHGWESPASLGTALVPGRGYTVNIAASGTVDFTGTLNNGTVNVGMLSRGTTAGSGWHLLGNPYPAPIDWDRVSLPTGVDNALYVFRSNGRYTGQYVSYVNGIGPAGADLLPAMQAFFVRVNSGSPSFSFSNAARLASYADPAFHRIAKPADTRPLLQLNLKNAAGSADELYVYQQAGATLNDDAAFDAYKIEGNGPTMPTLYAMTPNNKALSISGLPVLTQETIIPLGVYVGTAGNYTFQTVQLVNFPTSTEVFLEDRQTGSIQNLRANQAYTCQLAAGSNTTRFVLRFRPQTRVSGTAEALVASLQEAVVYPNPATEQGFTLRAGGLKAEKLQVMLYNQVGQLIESRTIVPENGTVEAKFLSNKLPKGIYTLKLLTSDSQVAKKVVLQ
ncbi:T9SS type A sorting domain-containing protein [Adhaeribacter soli]|uniref:T9SS type A sorting domain-containing protein n=1 Tax=Adhaeribacter soli TaxID=2607655 RepID=A0A5N1J4Z5_9BACT|nr:T9SS type A sorting domain-containing protein [Adhaeribacter soli]KAA9340149.1 T9SS type A sorting domain-containing protein [Adhaeribacter soli]